MLFLNSVISGVSIRFIRQNGFFNEGAINGGGSVSAIKDGVSFIDVVATKRVCFVVDSVNCVIFSGRDFSSKIISVMGHESGKLIIMANGRVGLAKASVFSPVCLENAIIVGRYGSD